MRHWVKCSGPVNHLRSPPEALCSFCTDYFSMFLKVRRLFQSDAAFPFKPIVISNFNCSGVGFTCLNEFFLSVTQIKIQFKKTKSPQEIYCNIFNDAPELMSRNLSLEVNRQKTQKKIER